MKLNDMYTELQEYLRRRKESESLENECLSDSIRHLAYFITNEDVYTIKQCGNNLVITGTNRENQTGQDTTVDNILHTIKSDILSYGEEFLWWYPLPINITKELENNQPVLFAVRRLIENEIQSIMKDLVEKAIVL